MLYCKLVDSDSKNHNDDFYEEGENVMIRVNCVKFNMTAADAQVEQLGIGGLWAWYDLGLNIWVKSAHLQAPGCWHVT